MFLVYNPAPPPPPVPSMVRYGSKALAIFSGGLWTNGGNVYYNLPEPSLSGNCLVFFLRLSGNFSPSSFAISDDKSNTWVAGPNTYNATGDQSFMCWYALNTTAGTRAIQVQNNTGNVRDSMQWMAAEFCNVNAIDVSNATTGNSSTASSGNITPTQTGDLIVMAGVRSTNTSLTSFSPGSQSNITWKLMGENNFNGHAMQWGVYNSTSTFNPQMPMSSSGQWEGISLAFKAASQGTPRPTNSMQVVGITGYDLRPGDFSTSQGIQLSVYGNLLVLPGAGGVGANAPTLTGVSDGDGNTWAAAVTSVENDTRVWQWYGRNMVANDDLLLTLTFNVSTGDFGFNAYDVAGAHATPLDNAATATGNQGSPGNLTTSTITPTTSNGLVICGGGQAFNTAVASASPTTNLFDSSHFDGQSLDGPSTPDENNFWAHRYNPDTSAVTFVFVEKSGSEAALNWASSAAAYKAA